MSTSEQQRADENATRQRSIEDYAAYWWAQESGETETWDELDDEEREAVIENSYAETVVDWLDLLGGGESDG